MVPRWQVQRILKWPTRVHQSPGRAEIVLTGRGKPEQAEEPGEDRGRQRWGGVFALPSLQSRLLVSSLVHSIFFFVFDHPLISTLIRKGMAI